MWRFFYHLSRYWNFYHVCPRTLLNISLILILSPWGEWNKKSEFSLDKSVHEICFFILQVWSEYCWEYSREWKKALTSLGLESQGQIRFLGSGAIWAIYIPWKPQNLPFKGTLCLDIERKAMGKITACFLLLRRKTQQPLNYHKQQTLFPGNITLTLHKYS